MCIPRLADPKSKRPITFATNHKVSKWCAARASGLIIQCKRMLSRLPSADSRVTSSPLRTRLYHCCGCCSHCRKNGILLTWAVHDETNVVAKLHLPNSFATLRALRLVKRRPETNSLQTLFSAKSRNEITPPSAYCLSWVLRADPANVSKIKKKVIRTGCVGMQSL